MRQIKVAVAQTDPELGNTRYNLETAKKLAREAQQNQAQLLVFPECSLTGYCFNSRDEAFENSLKESGTWVRELMDTARKTTLHLVVGFLETAGDKLYNSLLLIAPDGQLFKYRKTHLSNLGVDKFVDSGNLPFQVFDTAIGKIGGFICYEARFPEVARVLALKGAEVLIHITNLPETADAQVRFLLPARANENRVYVLSAGRVGTERGFRFLGKSSIYDIEGEIVSKANQIDETIIYSVLDLEKASTKKVFYPAIDGKPADHINDLFNCRRPELYFDLTRSLTSVDNQPNH